MAIARSGTASAGQITPGTEITFSHDAGSPANGFTQVSIINRSTASDNVTAVTYGATSMTRIGTFIGEGSISEYMYGLPHEKSGANNVVVSISASNHVDAWAASYSGVSQTMPPDSSNTGFDTDPANSPLAVATSVVATNCWLIGGSGQTNLAGFTPSAGAGTSLINQGGAGANVSVWDSNGEVGTGSQSLTITWTGTSDHFLMTVASIAPPGAAVASRIKGHGFVR